MFFSFVNHLFLEIFLMFHTTDFIWKIVQLLHVFFCLSSDRGEMVEKPLIVSEPRISHSIRHWFTECVDRLNVRIRFVGAIERIQLFTHWRFYVFVKNDVWRKLLKTLPQIISNVDNVNGMRTSIAAPFDSFIRFRKYTTNFCAWSLKIGMKCRSISKWKLGVSILRCWCHW